MAQAFLEVFNLKDESILGDQNSGTVKNEPARE